MGKKTKKVMTAPAHVAPVYPPDMSDGTPIEKLTSMKRCGPGRMARRETRPAGKPRSKKERGGKQSGGRKRTAEQLGCVPPVGGNEAGRKKVDGSPEKVKGWNKDSRKEFPDKPRKRTDATRIKQEPFNEPKTDKRGIGVDPEGVGPRAGCNRQPQIASSMV